MLTGATQSQCFVVSGMCAPLLSVQNGPRAGEMS